MTGTSLARYSNREQTPDAEGRKVYFERADLDGFPFRGPMPPAMPEAEYEARVVKTATFQFRFFDVSDPAQGKEYCDVMEKIANGWFQLRKQIDFVNGSDRHYVEWLEFYMEDGSTRARFNSQPGMEMPGEQI